MQFTIGHRPCKGARCAAPRCAPHTSNVVGWRSRLALTRARTRTHARMRAHSCMGWYVRPLLCPARPVNTVDRWFPCFSKIEQNFAQLDEGFSVKKTGLRGLHNPRIVRIPRKSTREESQRTKVAPRRTHVYRMSVSCLSHTSHGYNRW